MAAAYLIGTYLFRASADTKLHSVANEKAKIMADMVKCNPVMKEHIISIISNQFYVTTSVELADSAANPNCCKYNMSVCPHVQFSNDLRTMEIKIDITLTETDSGKSVFKNSFIYITDPAPPSIGISYWAKDDAERFFQVFEEALGKIVNMVDYDLLSGSGSTDETKVSTINYRNGLGIFYIRGTLLWHEDNRIIARDLRGNLLSFSGELK